MIVVVGARGQLGTAFRRLLEDDARYLTRADLNLSDRSAIRPALERLRPSLLINCAAYTAVDRAESEPDFAEAVNAAAVGAMAETMAELGGRFLTFSTDYVFDGTAKRPYLESDTPNPINAYGRTKREGEIAAMAANSAALVVRTSWVLSGTHRNFATTMIRLAREGDVSVVDDQCGHPTLVNDLAGASLAALNSGATGILHLTNAGATTWFGLAREVIKSAGLALDRIHPCSTSDYPSAANRPSNSLLASERLDRLKLDPLPSYRPGLRQAVSEILSWLQ